MANEYTTTRLAELIKVDAIIDLATRVQAALTASGSLQELGSFTQNIVSNAINEQRCFVMEDTCGEILGCAFIRPIDEEYFAHSSEFDIKHYPKPWLYLHSIMLTPEVQGKGVGLKMFADIVHHLRPSGGTVLLDCWAGSDKLRSFYARAGCDFVATLPEHDYEIAVFVRVLTKTMEDIA